MKTRSLVGVIVGGTSIAFSSLCFVIAPVFTPAVVLAVVVGAIGGSVALALQARRTALVAFAFAVTPLLGLLMIQYAAERVGTGYIAFAPLVVAVIVAAWALCDFRLRIRIAT